MSVYSFLIDTFYILITLIFTPQKYKKNITNQNIFEKFSTIFNKSTSLSYLCTLFK